MATYRIVPVVEGTRRGYAVEVCENEAFGWWRVSSPVEGGVIASTPVFFVTAEDAKQWIDDNQSAKELNDEWLSQAPEAYEPKPRSKR